MKNFRENQDTFDLNVYSSSLLHGKAYSRLHACLTKALQPFNVSFPEWKLLGQLYEHGNIKLSVLAELLSYDPPMVTKLVKQLEKKMLVRREPDAVDERAKIIIITNEGRTLTESAEPEVKKIMQVIFSGISQEEMSIYLKVLTAIVTNTNE